MSDHPRAGQDTYFVEKFLNTMNVDYTNPDYLILLQELNPLIEAKSFWESLESQVFNHKHHTCRAGIHFKPGDMISIRVWSGLPYRSKQIRLLPDFAVPIVYDLKINNRSIFVDGVELCHIPKDGSSILGHWNLNKLAANDGLQMDDFIKWFKFPKEFNGQIIYFSIPKEDL